MTKRLLLLLFICLCNAGQAQDSEGNDYYFGEHFMFEGISTDKRMLVRQSFSYQTSDQQLWCAPCISQMPYSKKMHHEAKENKNPIAFVYLCTSSSSSQEKWKNKVLELEQPGTHIYIDQKLINELMTLFNKSGFPSYVVIKPNGEIDTGAVDWMSNTSIDELKKLL